MRGRAGECVRAACASVCSSGNLLVLPQDCPRAPPACVLGRALLSCLPPGPGLRRVSSSSLAGWGSLQSPRHACASWAEGLGVSLRCLLTEHTCALPAATGAPERSTRLCLASLSAFKVS